MKVQVMTIGPEEAATFLAMNTHNRMIRPRHVAFLADEIRGGRWHLTNDAITVSETNVLLNGQHRLRAIIDAGTPVQLLVLFGADVESQVVTDTGNRRNLADALRIAGFDNLAALAATVTFVFRMTDPLLSFPATRAKKYPYQPQIDFAIKHESELFEAIRMARHVREHLVFPGRIISGLWFLQAELDREDADTFWCSIASGAALAEDDPRLIWRRWCERLRTNGRNTITTEPVQVAMVIKAWNTWRAGGTTRLLTWKPGGASPEAFPELR